MIQVVTLLNQIRGTSLLKLTPADARQQFGAEDAAKILECFSQGSSTATIIAAQLDPLQSDGQAYAAKLQAAGVSVAYQLYPGVTHEFFGMGAILGRANEAEHFAASQLAASFK